MLRGLARWLRACGYDASWTYGIADEELLRQARRENRLVLTADGPLLDRRTVKAGRPPALRVPNEQPPLEQAAGVLATLGLPVRPARCMACGGALRPVEKAAVADEAPPRTFACVDRFFRCGRCGRLLWEGTHWERIAARRRQLAGRLGERAEPG